MEQNRPRTRWAGVNPVRLMGLDGILGHTEREDQCHFEPPKKTPEFSAFKASFHTDFSPGMTEGWLGWLEIFPIFF